MYAYIYIYIYIYIYTIVNKNIKKPTGRIYGIYPRPQGSYTTAEKLYNHIKVRSRVQQEYMPYIIPGMTSCTCAVDLVTKSLQMMKAMSTSKHTKEALFVSYIAESVRCVSLLLVSIVLFFFDVSLSYSKYYTWEISEQVMTSFFHEEIIHHVTNMLKRNVNMKFLKVRFWGCIPSKDTYKKDWIPTIHQFWETVLLHSPRANISVLGSYICHMSLEAMVYILHIYIYICVCMYMYVYIYVWTQYGIFMYMYIILYMYE